MGQKHVNSFGEKILNLKSENVLDVLLGHR